MCEKICKATFSSSVTIVIDGDDTHLSTGGVEQYLYRKRFSNMDVACRFFSMVHDLTHRHVAPILPPFQVQNDIYVGFDPVGTTLDEFLNGIANCRRLFNFRDGHFFQVSDYFKSILRDLIVAGIGLFKKGLTVDFHLATVFIKENTGHPLVEVVEVDFCDSNSDLQALWKRLKTFLDTIIEKSCRIGSFVYNTKLDPEMQKLLHRLDGGNLCAREVEELLKDCFFWTKTQRSRFVCKVGELQESLDLLALTIFGKCNFQHDWNSIIIGDPDLKLLKDQHDLYKAHKQRKSNSGGHSSNKASSSLRINCPEKEKTKGLDARKCVKHMNATMTHFFRHKHDLRMQGKHIVFRRREDVQIAYEFLFPNLIAELSDLPKKGTKYATILLPVIHVPTWICQKEEKEIRKDAEAFDNEEEDEEIYSS